MTDWKSVNTGSPPLAVLCWLWVNGQPEVGRLTLTGWHDKTGKVLRGVTHYGPVVAPVETIK